MLILLNETPAASYLRTLLLIKWVSGVVSSIPRVIPVSCFGVVPALTPVYLITSLPIWTYPGLVALTERFSKLDKNDTSLTSTAAVELCGYSTFNFAVVVTPTAPEIVTLLFAACIPWFLCFTWKCNPSFSGDIVLTDWGTPLFNAVPTVLLLLTGVNAPEVPKSPSTLFKITLLTFETAPALNLIFLAVSPKLAPRTSPTLYPDPPPVTLIAFTAPFWIVTVATAPVPSPVILVKPIPVYAKVPDAGVNPIPVVVW